ncbi:MAG: sigma-70 family RNA polymerase sigma factor [Planctomycetes bacterium]|nr:sigma-70 family RNA polymerase sigma factor [Planctomycetota bacterium]
MALAPSDAVRKVFDRVRDSADHGDGELLARYRHHRDQDAFRSLVSRHGPMVLGVCRRVLRDFHAADDAFQATFLVLAKKADAVRPSDRLAPWLCGVAYRTAMKARGRAFRRQQVERAYAAEARERTAAPSDGTADLLPVIDEQLNALPEKYRMPLVLCGVQGLNKAEAATRLGLPEGTVSSRLARAREMLRDRLTRRGLVVPAALLGAILTPNALHATVSPALAASAVEVTGGVAPASPTVLALTQEVLRSMSLLKLKALCAVAMAVGLAGGGFGLYAVHADEKKPGGEKPAVEPAEKPGEKPAAKPDGEKPKPAASDGEKKPAKPDGEKKPGMKSGGKVASVDAKESTIVLAIKGDGGVVEKLFPVAPDAKVTIDGKDAKLADVPKNAAAAFVAAPGKEGQLPRITELRVTGSVVGGVIKEVTAGEIALENEKKPQAFKVAADTKVTVNGREAKVTDLKAGDKVVVTLRADESTALSVATGAKGDGEKPGVKNPKLSGKVAAVDAPARTVTLAAKGEGGKVIVVRLTADAKIVADGKTAKIGDIPIGVVATFSLVAAKDGQPREANEVVVAGPTFGGTVKQIDTTTVTVGTEKNDRVLKLAAGGKVLIGEKEGKLADLKVGDKVIVTLTSDESAATQIQSGGKKPVGDKPRPEKE